MYRAGLSTFAIRDEVYNFYTLTLCPVSTPLRCTRLGSLADNVIIKVYHFCTLTLYPVRVPQRCTKLGSILTRYVVGILYVLTLYSQFSLKKL